MASPLKGQQGAGVSKNMQQRSQADTDSCHGLFDTRAGSMAGMARLSSKRVFVH